MNRATLISTLVAKGGPEPPAYEALTELVTSLRGALDANEVDDSELAALRAAFGYSLSLSTMQGFAFPPPHGYAGDCDRLVLHVKR